MEYEKTLELVPLWHKTALTLEEATAYCGIGKHKLAPVLSPKKSIEGSVGGILGSALIGALYGLVLSRTGVMEIAYQILIFAGIGAACLEFLGKLSVPEAGCATGGNSFR